MIGSPKSRELMPPKLFGLFELDELTKYCAGDEPAARPPAS